MTSSLAMFPISPFSSFLSGALFGGSLTLAGIDSPCIIQSQIRMQSTHMLETFLAATASSALTLHLLPPLLQRISISSSSGIIASLRSPHPLSLITPTRTSTITTANLVGGALVGLAMTLTGACPATLLPQLAASVPSAPWVLLGSALGALTLVFIPLPTNPDQNHNKNATTLDAIFGISRITAVMFFQVACWSAIALLHLKSPSTTARPVFGGLVIGTLAQGGQLLLTGRTLGSSRLFWEEMADSFAWLWGLPSSIPGTEIQKESQSKTRAKLNTPELQAPKNPSIFKLKLTLVARPRPLFFTPALFSTLGTYLGSLLVLSITSLVSSVSSIHPTPAITIQSPSPSKVQSIVGGMLLMFGSRLAGGCTSGHGISGMSLLSTRSCATVGVIFGAGVLAALIL